MSWFTSIFPWSKKSPKQTHNAYDQVIVLDTETTALDESAKILSFAAIPCSNNECHIKDALSFFLKWDKVSLENTPSIHGITFNKLQEDGIEPLEAIKTIHSFLNKKPIVGHHISFDLMVLNKHFKAFGLEPLPNQHFCTAEIAKRLERPALDLMPSYSLDAVCGRYKIPIYARHTAAGDTISTAYLWLKLRSHLKRRQIQI